MSNFTPEQVQEILDLYFENFAHRQYIGARYVPIFGRKGETSIEWDNSAPYEPLTIVLHEGNSYTSRQFVPTGVAITNELYWAETGSYNAQVEQYRQEVLGFEEDVTGLDTRLTSLENIIPDDSFDSEHTIKDYIDGEVSTVNDSISSISTRVENQENYGKVIVVIGDSYGEGWDPDTSTSHDGWCSKFASIMSEIGVTCKTAYQGGVGFVAGSNGFLTLLQGVVSSMTATEKARCEKVVIAGGFNDRGQNETSISSGIKDVANYIRDNLPNAYLYVSHPGYCVTGRTTGIHSSATSATCITSYLNYMRGCSKVGASFDLGSWATLNNENYFYSDFVHPNETGNTWIAYRLVNFIMNGKGICQDTNASKDTVANWLTLPKTNETVEFPSDLLWINDPDTGLPQGLSLAGGGFFNFRWDISAGENVDITTSLQLATIKVPGITGISVYVPAILIFECKPDSATPTQYITLPGVFKIGPTGSVTVRYFASKTDYSNYMTLQHVRGVQIELQQLNGYY